MAKTSIVDEIEHHPQFCLDLSDPLGAIRMGNSIGRFGDRHPAPALGFNARDRYFHFRRTFDVATRQRFETAGTAAWAYSICTNTCPQPHSEDKNLVSDFLTRLAGTRLGFDHC